MQREPRCFRSCSKRDQAPRLRARQGRCRHHRHGTTGNLAYDGWNGGWMDGATFCMRGRSRSGGRWAGRPIFMLRRALVRRRGREGPRAPCGCGPGQGRQDRTGQGPCLPACLALIPRRHAKHTQGGSSSNMGSDRPQYSS